MTCSRAALCSVYDFSPLSVKLDQKFTTFPDFSEGCQKCTLEWFSEAGSAPIRSAMKFYFDIDVRIFFNFFKKIFFSIDQKKIGKSWKFSKKSKIFKEKKSRFSTFWKFENFWLFSTFFWSIEKIFFWRSWKKSGHQYRSKISLRIEWEYSQPLKINVLAHTMC